jgi:hypothetical protein
MAEIPQYLAEMLAHMPQRPEPVPAPVAPGDIRLCDGDGGRAHVLVLETHERHVNIALCTNEVEIASDQTPILTEAMTGLPYELLATNLCGPVFPHQLSTSRLAHLAEVAAIKRMLFGDWSVWAEYPHVRRGLPFQGRGWRWTAHEDKLRELQSLCRPALLELLGEE